MSLRTLLPRLLPTVLALLLSGASVHGQQPASLGVDSVRADSAPAASRYPRHSGLDRNSAPLLDAPVDRAVYRLGPGDQVDVAIFGELNQVYTLRVTPEGSVLIPTIGIARVLGMNLAEAEAHVRELVRRYYRNVDVRLALSEVRTFKVFVVGAVPQPGMRVATAATRVSEVIEGQTQNGTIRRRNITLRRTSGDTLAVDLVRFLQTGDFGANPTLREGDVVLAPVIDEHVNVYGRVHFSGPYEYRPGESLADLLTIANGGTDFPANAADTVRLVRFEDERNRTTHLFRRDEALGARGRAFLLQPFDGIYVPERSNFKEQKTAAVEGQVMRPGIYPIHPGATTVRDLVEMAGGLTSEASLPRAVLRRESSSSRPNELSRIPPELLTSDERRILQIRTQADPGNVVVDFEKLLAAGDDSYDQPLREGDVLSIPRRRDEVTVLGAVRQPGIVAHTREMPVSYFIRAAGGYSRRADQGDVVVLKARQGARVHWKEVREVEPGDIVIVPFRERHSPMEILQNTQAVVGTITGLILTFIAIF